MSQDRGRWAVGQAGGAPSTGTRTGPYVTGVGAWEDAVIDRESGGEHRCFDQADALL
jgi:hypothetical protein